MQPWWYAQLSALKHFRESFVFWMLVTCCCFDAQGQVRAPLQSLLLCTLNFILAFWGCLQVMTLLSGLYKEYDQRAVELGLYTVDTVGDCEYPGGRGNIATNCWKCSLQISLHACEPCL
eukprot:1147599-Pelagomonas_calceolata.AAC.2